VSEKARLFAGAGDCVYDFTTRTGKPPTCRRLVATAAREAHLSRWGNKLRAHANGARHTNQIWSALEGAQLAGAGSGPGGAAGRPAGPSGTSESAQVSVRAPTHDGSSNHFLRARAGRAAPPAEADN
jgi:hypothetical protein